VKNLKSAVLTKHGFTLIEILVALTIFATIVVSVTGVLISIRCSWKKQQAAIDLIQHSRWAMEFTCNELRQGSTPAVGIVSVVTQTLSFMNASGAKVWYWRGPPKGPLADGNTTILFRGIDGPGDGVDNAIEAADPQSLQDANTNRQEMTGFVVDNTSGNNIFTLAGGLCTIELTLRPNPGSPVGTGNHDFTLRSQARARN
jgi:prepilin-type N-terminal cleavage/methylation domain-containing protein